MIQKPFGVSTLSFSPQSPERNRRTPQVILKARQEDLANQSLLNLSESCCDSLSVDSSITAPASYKHPHMPLNLPINKSTKREIVIEVSAAQKSSPNTKLDILDSFLPKDLRGQRNKAAEARLQALQQQLANSSISATRQWNDANGAIEDMDTMNGPVHNASGTMSVAMEANADNNRKDIGIDNNHNHRLWGDDNPAESVLEREIRMINAHREQVMADLTKAANLKKIAEDARIAQEIQDRKLVIRTIRLLFSGQFKFDRGGGASRRQLVGGKASAKKAFAKADKLKQFKLANATINEDVESTPVRPPIASAATEAFSDTGTGQLMVLTHNDSCDSGASMASLTTPRLETPNLDIRPPSQFHRQDTDDSFNLNQHEGTPTATRQNSRPVTAMVAAQSKIKEKLMNLGRFVLGHTNRKIMLSWANIEQRFSKSPLVKVHMERDCNGLLHPVKYAAITLSALTAVLCSPLVKVGFNELPVLYERFNITNAEVLLSRKIAAIRAVLGPTNGAGFKQATALKLELQALTKDDEKTLSIEDLRNVAFPEDPEERAREIENLSKEREAMMHAFVEEKKKKDEVREKAAQRKRRMVEDFEDAVHTVQLPKGPMSVYKHSMLNNLISFCQMAVLAANAEKDVTVSDELLLLLGFEAFPKIIQESMNASTKTKEIVNEGKMLTKQPLKASKSLMRSSIDIAVAVNKLKGSMKHLPNQSLLHAIGNVASLAEAEIDDLDEAAHELAAGKKATVAKKGGDIKLALSKQGFNGKFRVKINGPPTVLSVLRETVSYGKGLNGFAYRDVVEMLQAYACTRLQAFARGFMKRWRFAGARRKWNAIFRAMKMSHYKAWALLTRHNFDTRHFCWRKLISWGFYTRRAKRRREIFRCCYWGFYVWRRTATASAKAKEKSRFLTGRVMPTLLTLRTFRGWKKYVKEELRLNAIADTNFAKLQLGKVRISLAWLWRWTRRRRLMRRAWFKDGLNKYRKQILHQKNTPFQIWHTYVYYKKLLRVRVFQFGALFRHILVKGLPPMPAPDRTERRRKIQETRAQSLAEDKKLRKKEEKEKRKLDEAKKRQQAANLDMPLEVANAGKNTGVSDSEDESKKLLSNKRGRNVDFGAARRVASLFTSKRKFDWKAKKIDFDVDTDGEDEEDLPNCLKTIYRSDIAPLVRPEEIDFLHWTEPAIVQKIALMARGFRFCETWALLESASRYHRFMYRAFKNLHIYAIVRRNARLSIRYVRLERKQAVFSALLGWMSRDPKYVSREQAQSEGEVLSNEVRAERLNKLMRRRNAAIEIKEVFGREHGDPVMEEYDPTPAQRKAKRQFRPILRARGQSTDVESPSSAVSSDHRHASPSHTQSPHAGGNMNSYLDAEAAQSMPVYKPPLSPSALPDSMRMTIMRPRTVEIEKDDKVDKFVKPKLEKGRAFVPRAQKARAAPVVHFTKKSKQIPAKPIPMQLTPSTGQGPKKATGPLTKLKQPPSSGLKHTQGSMTMLSAAIGAVAFGSDSVSTDEATQALLDEMTATANENVTVATVQADDESQVFVYSSNIAPITFGEVEADASSTGSLTDQSSIKSTATGGSSVARKRLGLKQSIANSKKAAKLRKETPAGKAKKVSHDTDMISEVVKIKLDPATYKPPNVLTWDQEDREVERKLAEHMVELSKTLRENSMAMCAEADYESKVLHAQYEKRELMVGSVMAEEGALTQVAVDNEIAYISKFKLHAADNMLCVLVKIHRQVQNALMKAEAKKYFRGLRMPMLQKRGRMMLNRKKMVNWIRICRRLSAIDKLAPFYRSKRTMWVLFNRWIKLVEKESMNATPGLVLWINRRAELHPSFDDYLKEKGFTLVVYVDNSRLLREASDYKALFKRWKMHVQEEKVFGKMFELAALSYELKMKQKCFICWRYDMTFQDTATIREKAPSFPLTRVACDLDHISKRFIAHRRRGLPQTIKNYNRRYFKSQKLDGQKALSFRKYLEDHDWEISTRLVTEQRILSEAFESRGSQDYIDFKVPTQVTDPIMPAIMSRLDGKKFSDPKSHPPGMSGQSKNHLPGGLNIHKVRLNFQEHMGVVGWQIVWLGDGIRPIEAPKRGKWNGAGMTVQELVMPKDDFAMGVEYLYEGSTILGLRLKLFFEGWTKWLGGKASLSTLSMYLGVEECPVQDFENEYVPPNLDEVNNTALPRSFIIGFSGLENVVRATCMGIIVRKVKEQTIFSYHWVQDAFDIVATQNSGNAAGGSMQFEGASMPSFVAPQGGVGLNESLTMSALPKIRGLNGSLVKSSGAVADSKAITDELESDDGENLNPIVLGVSVFNPDQIYDDESSRSNSLGFDDGFFDDDDEHGENDPNEPPDNAQAYGNISQPSRLMSQLSTVGGDVPELSTSETQFFDVIRMRTMEVKVARIRVEEFARNIWSNMMIRRDPQLVKLTPVNIVAQLAKWLFQALCKRLVGLSKNEKKGTQFLTNAHLMRVKSEVLDRRCVGIHHTIDGLETNALCWQRKSMLSPAERLLKKQQLEEIKLLYDEIKGLKVEAAEMLQQAIVIEKQGRYLLSRLPLSQYVCRSYRLKIAAARHKESLLERMDMETIKHALCGTGEKDTSLSNTAMMAIKSSLQSKKHQVKESYSLDEVVEEALQFDRDNERKRLIELDKASPFSKASMSMSGSHTPTRYGRRLNASMHASMGHASLALSLSTSSLPRIKPSTAVVSAPVDKVLWHATSKVDCGNRHPIRFIRNSKKKNSLMATIQQQQQQQQEQHDDDDLKSHMTDGDSVSTRGTHSSVSR